jgi:hypothetical protein
MAGLPSAKWLPSSFGLVCSETHPPQVKDPHISLKPVVIERVCSLKLLRSAFPLKIAIYHRIRSSAIQILDVAAISNS